MSIILHAVFIVVFENIDFCTSIVILNNHDQKTQFSASSQNSSSKKSVFDHFKVIFLNV